MLVKSIPDEAGIPYVVQGDLPQDLFGWGRIGTGFSTVAGPVRFLVRPDDAEAAHALIRDLEDDTEGAKLQSRCD